MKTGRFLGLLAAAFLISGCRQELTQLVFLTGDTQSVTIERIVLPDKFLADGGALNSSVTMGACAQVPDVWGAPTATNVFGLVNGQQLSDAGLTVSRDTETEAAAQADFARADHTWYCYQLPPSADFVGTDSGGISWTFDATTESAKVISTIGIRGQLMLMVVHDVNAGTEVPLRSWEALTVSTSGATLSSPVSTSKPLYPQGEFGGSAIFSRNLAANELLLVDANAAVTAVQLPFAPAVWGSNQQIVAASDALLVGFEVNAKSQSLALPYTSTDGENWTAGSTSFPASGVPVRVDFSNALGRFYAVVDGSANVHYSADGLDWSSSAAIGGTVVFSGGGVAALPNGELLVLATDGNTDTGLFLINASSGGSQVLARPDGASADWFVSSVQVVGDRAFAVTGDPGADGGPVYLLLTSIDGESWTQIAEAQGLFAQGTAGVKLGSTFLVSFNGDYFVSIDNGTNFSPLDLSTAAGSFLADKLALPFPLVTSGQDVFLPLSLTNNSTVEAALVLHTEDLQSFSLSASQHEQMSYPEYGMHVVTAGEAVLQFGEGQNGFQAYRYVSGAPADSNGGSDSVTAADLLFDSDNGGAGSLYAILAALFCLMIRRRQV